MNVVRLNELLDKIEWSLPLENAMKPAFEAVRTMRKEINDEGTRMVPICVACGKPAIGRCDATSSIYHRTQ